ncbi:DUF4832 domain-containing protein [Vibrio sp. IRLE0018]|uniref:DUF4832 domain-containing protein n=1 Tax=Vibrio floridensis TaxID=2908007 RepID=UPI001F385A58|nr:DUF4832 domain-containing protein [Vibrio floridensis]MCF8778290.1 DUF4832 domain-containing protein [Vibrio floridensis]
MKLHIYQKALIVSLCVLPITACYAKKEQIGNPGNNKPDKPIIDGGDSIDEGWVTVTPSAVLGPISNPGVGVETFHDSWGVSLNKSEYPDAGIDYYRFYWSELEPKEGEYNFALLDQLLLENRHELPAKMVALRFMTADEPNSGSKIPRWLIDKGIAGDWSQDHSTFIPSLDDTVYLDYMAKFLYAFGQRYDGNANLSHIDIGMVGSWGEWHNSNFANLPPLHQRYSTDELNHIIDLHFAAFPKTAKVMLISGGDSLAYATEKGAGWRADCWGDWHHFSASWSHMKDDYPHRIEQATTIDSGFKETWQQAPVSLETCGTMQEWQTMQRYSLQEVQASLDWALAQHASSLNLKSKPIPDEYRPLLDEALTKLGYRLRIERLSHQQQLTAGSTWVVDTQFVNEGVAPPYIERYIAYRLVDDSEQVHYMAISDYDVKAMLPGKHPTRTSLTLPRTLPLGEYSVEIALIDSHGDLPLQLANDGKQLSGWYRLSRLIIQ